MSDKDLPENAPVPEEPAVRNGMKRLSWQWFKLWGKRVLAVLAGIPTLIIGTWIVVSVLMLTFQRHNLDIDGIGVPEALSKAGFTSEVATERLRDAIFAVQDLSHTTMAKTGIDTDQELSVITIPKTGLSLQDVAVTLRSLFPHWQRKITGEFTQSGNQLSLQLRLTGRKIFEKVAATADPDAASALIGPSLESGAFKVVKRIEPFIAASALYGDGKSTDLAPAEKAADEIIDRFPPGDENVPPKDENVMRAVNLKGLIAYKRGDYPTAKAYYERAPQLAVAHANLGILYQDRHYEQYDLGKALGEYQTAISLDPEDAWPHNNLGKLHRDQHKPDAAIAEYHTAIRLDPDSAPPRVGLCVVYRDQHKLDVAIAECQTAIRLDPKGAPSHVALGDVYRDQHKPDQAIDEYQTAISLDEKDVTPHNNLGDLYSEQHRAQAAIDEFQAAIHLDPKGAEPHFNLGNVYNDQHMLDAAIDEYQTAISLDPKYAAPHNNLGLAYRDQNKVDAAIDEFQAAIHLDPKNAEPHNNLGNVYSDQHKLEAAIDEYRTAIRLSPTVADPYYNMGLALLGESRSSEGGNPQRLQDACRAFILGSKLDSNDLDYLDRITEVDAMMTGQRHCPP
jgi:tetratricopeptide (TPR) repeat protein